MFQCITLKRFEINQITEIMFMRVTYVQKLERNDMQPPIVDKN